MGKFIPGLISILAPTPKKKERHEFSTKVKREVVHKQKDMCGICGEYLNNWDRDFHHKDKNKSNNNPSNCQAVHTRCHRTEHVEKRSTKHYGLFFKINPKKGLIALLFVLACTICLGTGIALADPMHCDREGYPSCYSVGYANGWRHGTWDKGNQQEYNPPCASGHSEKFCTGYGDGYNQGWNSNSGTSSNTMGQSQFSGVDIRGNNNKVTVNQRQDGQMGSDESQHNQEMAFCRDV